MNREAFWGLIIVIGILMFFIAIGLVIVEVSEAKSFCSHENGSYSFNFAEIKYYCDDFEIARYKNGWDFVKFRSDWSKIEVELP